MSTILPMPAVTRPTTDESEELINVGVGQGIRIA